jgi:hypothetical protein
MQKYIYDFCLERPDLNSGISAHLAILHLFIRFALYRNFKPRRTFCQRLPRLGRLGFPSKLLRRFLRGCVVATAQGLVTAPASVFVDARKKTILINRILSVCFFQQ